MLMLTLAHVNADTYHVFVAVLEGLKHSSFHNLGKNKWTTPFLRRKQQNVKFKGPETL